MAHDRRETQDKSNQTNELLQQQYLRLRARQAAVYSRPDPMSDAQQRAAMLREEGKLREVKEKTEPAPATPSAESAPRSRLLGGKTGLKVTFAVNLDPLPTGVYHVLNPNRHPLITVDVSNESTDVKRVRVQAYIEGLSTTAVHTAEIARKATNSFKLLPTLLPDRVALLGHTQRVTLHALVEELGGELETHETFTPVCLARTASFNGVTDPSTGKEVDLSAYYGAWVTPYQELVQERIRRAADLGPHKRIWGYQAEDPTTPTKGDLDGVTAQVKALYQSLREVGIVYVNSVIDFGAPPGIFTQRTRLPTESLARKSANCIDGTVLMASLLEGASLNPVLVFVPGHAFVGWESWEGRPPDRFLETTMIGYADFEAAHESGQKQFEEQSKSGTVTLHRLTELRAKGIWPME